MCNVLNCVLILIVTFLCAKVHGQSKDIFTDNDLVVQLAKPSSKIRGHILQSAHGKDYWAFQQIPYAKPPIGDLRFRGPKEHEGWEGILNATENTRVCPQIFPTYLPQNEDCLHINVYTPVKPNSHKKLAVYLWIHGGGFMFWESSIYRFGPKYFMDYDIVVVTFNHRMGAFGYLALENGLIPGNIGFRDQNLAMIWVRNNIHLFGGDPDKVTLGGESTGSTAVGIHMISPLSRGLFRGAIQQSGGAFPAYVYQPNPDFYAYQLGQLLDNTLEYGDSSNLIDILRKATAVEIVEAQKKITSKEQTIAVIPDLTWAGTLETSVREEEAFLWKPMYDTFLNGKGDWYKVPILLGYNKLEALFFTPDQRDKGPLIVSWEEINDIMTYLDADSSRLINKELNIPDKNKKKAGALIKKLFTNSTFVNAREAYLEFSSAVYFSFPVIHQADLVCKDAPTYLYQFSYTPLPQDKARGAERTEELKYLWDNIEDAPFVNEFQKVLRHRMLKLWTNFIKYQNPTPKYDKLFSGINWPTVKPHEIIYMNINETLKIQVNPKRYCHYREVFTKYMKPPMIVF